MRKHRRNAKIHWPIFVILLFTASCNTIPKEFCETSIGAFSPSGPSAEVRYQKLAQKCKQIQFIQLDKPTFMEMYQAEKQAYLKSMCTCEAGFRDGVKAYKASTRSGQWDFGSRPYRETLATNIKQCQEIGKDQPYTAGMDLGVEWYKAPTVIESLTTLMEPDPSEGAVKQCQNELQKRTDIKVVNLPFKKGTEIYVSQGAFGKASHSESGNQYSWDFDVPLKTSVLAVESGKVIDIYNPPGGGGCDSKFSNEAHNIKVEASDGTVAQYVHIEPRVSMGQLVKQGQIIAVTAINGFICNPQLHFGIYNSRNELYESPRRKTIPLRFAGVNGGLLVEGSKVSVP